MFIHALVGSTLSIHTPPSLIHTLPLSFTPQASPLLAFPRPSSPSLAPPNHLLAFSPPNPLLAPHPSLTLSGMRMGSLIHTLSYSHPPLSLSGMRAARANGLSSTASLTIPPPRPRPRRPRRHRPGCCVQLAPASIRAPTPAAGSPMSSRDCPPRCCKVPQTAVDCHRLPSSAIVCHRVPSNTTHHRVPECHRVPSQ